jgi:heme-degrading monooxygenase HmoA
VQASSLGGASVAGDVLVLSNGIFTERGGTVIARIWRGGVRTEDADEYVGYVRDTGIEHYRSTPGNLGAWILHRPVGDRTEIVTFSLWEDMDAVRAFAGDDPAQAVYYPEDDRFLVERSSIVDHYEVD